MKKLPKPRSPLQKKLAKVMAKVSATATIRTDEALIQLKQLMDVIREEERNTLKAWIEKVIPLERSPASSLRGTLKIELRHPAEDGMIHVTGLTASAIKKAIDHWERGELYAPATFGELGIG